VSLEPLPFRSHTLLRAGVAVAVLVVVGLAGYIAVANVTHVDPAGLRIPAAPSATAPTPTPTPLSDIGRAALSSVVTVEAQLPTEESLGTAWLFDAKGDFVTNAHVVANQIAIRVTDRQNHTHTAVVLGMDTTADIALLRVSGVTATPLVVDRSAVSGPPFAVVTLASGRATGQDDITDDTVVGLYDDVPLGSGETQPGQQAPTVYHDMLHLAGSRIYEGNSGGPVLDQRGEVVGIVTLASPGNPDAYAIPISRVIAELEGFAARSG
jgi:serine protease Do